ncbi:C6 transcription factor (Fcr1) [Pyrenophora tritici-repentis]|nr:C6 transcription factor (Fcr1) [Pyrenophora tritici-repentis]KAI0618222.1 C6 transcription factor (Fcr1) [Pyrenophora tritici-repentis]
MSPHRSDSMEAQDSIRKRVCKACDRCRLKKSKCDGASPCSRCKADNAICVFGERKKSQDKVYPKGYVEMLEQQQSQLVAGLRELYTRLQRGESWPGQPLQETASGYPLTHDILERLDLLNSPSENGTHYEGFEEDCSRMQQRLLEGGAPYTRRRISVSSESDHGHASSSSSYNGTPTTRSVALESPFARNTAPPTPPMNSPFPRQSEIVQPIKQEPQMASPVFMSSGAMDPSTLSRAPWMNDSTIMMDDSIDFKPMYEFDSYGNYDQSMMVDTIAMNPSDPMMPDWNTHSDMDFTTFIQNPARA